MSYEGERANASTESARALRAASPDALTKQGGGFFETEPSTGFVFLQGA